MSRTLKRILLILAATWAALAVPKDSAVPLTIQDGLIWATRAFFQVTLSHAIVSWHSTHAGMLIPG